MVQGTFKASKGRQTVDKANLVQALLCIFRLPNVASDVVITLTTPVHINENSAVAQHIEAGDKFEYQSAPDLFQRMLATIAISDWGLFGGA